MQTRDRCKAERFSVGQVSDDLHSEHRRGFGNRHGRRENRIWGLTIPSATHIHHSNQTVDECLLWWPLRYRQLGLESRPGRQTAPPDSGTATWSPHFLEQDGNLVRLFHDQSAQKRSNYFPCSQTKKSRHFDKVVSAFHFM